ncbi:BTAD domain-containing putative transcriptional regulator [Prauserella muralis]|uniref:SARP family transcriptional regulator n=1 Tax=Prauserella muralis TaxID=588067 RepID=A0A2V4B7E7_9PSEU|nr:BTAD domain-containing putative transcriptional regulator [Prauserella muralis]PXY31157.1 SARP family transcriptional regulator [Prauserella muralis]TWE14548.1 putative ATPase [Prauserella muralis]
MRIALLGPLRVTGADATPVAVGGSRLRMLLTRLALDAGRGVSTEALVDGLWGGDPPSDAANALQSLVSRLRKALGSDLVRSTGTGYLLAVEPGDVDVHRFEELAAHGARELAAGRAAEAAELLTSALDVFAGEPLADAAGAPFARAPAARLAELRLSTAEDLFDAKLRLGRHAQVLADLETAAAEHPLRERLAALHIRALAAAGRQSEALAAYERVRVTLADELGIDPSTELAEAHLAVLRGESPATPSPAPPAPPGLAGTELPGRLTSFIGRERELATLARLLSEARLVTLTGPGGAGKTRLAVETAARHPAHERGRVWFVPLAGVRDERDVPGAVLGTLEPRRLHTAPAPDASAEAIDLAVEALRGGEALLVLDNCEHVVDAAARLAHDLLSRLPALRILATSREALAIGGEQLVPVGPLELPPADAEPAEAAGSAAVRLFVDRAAAVRPGFTLDDDSTAAVVEICTRLDGMPLALELAAARLRSMPPAHVAKHLDDRFRLLTSGSRIALPRQRTLRAVVEWSWDLLDEPERMLARRLAVFTGGATTAAAEAVCADDGLPEADIVYLLGSLVEKSIVEQVGELADQPRYRMLETIRAYARERLAEAGETAAVTERFAAYFLRVAEEQEPALRGEGQVGALALLDTEHGNLITALRAALDANDADTAYRIAAALCWYWVLTRIIGQPVRLLNEVLSRADGDRCPARSAIEAFRTLLDFLGCAPGAPEVREVAENCRHTRAAERYPGLAVVLPMLALLSRNSELVREELDRALAHPDPWARTVARWAEALRLDDVGDLAGAQRIRDEVLRGFTAVGDRWGQAMTLAMKAQGHTLRGDHAAALDALERGRAVAMELGTGDDAVQLSLRAVEEHLRHDDIESARRGLDEARRIAAGVGQRQVQVYVELTAVELARRTGDFAHAHRLLDDIGRAMTTLDFGSGVGREWLATAETALLLSEGRTAEARQALAETVQAAAGRGDMPDTARAAELLAGLRHQEGSPEEAAAALGLSHAIRGVFDHGSPELRELTERLVTDLGLRRYRAAYDEAARLPREDAVRVLREQADQASRLR